MDYRRNSFFNGRYGVDPLSILLLCVAALLLGVPYLWVLSLLLFAAVIFRALSHNLDARRREMQWLNGLFQRIASGFHRLTGRAGGYSSPGRAQDRRMYLIIKCPKCKTKLRLPRGRGKLEVTCTVCGHVFRHKT